MDTYLAIENEIGYLSSKYASNSTMFSSIIDSLLLEKSQSWRNFSQQSQLSPLAMKVTQAAYIYPYANRLERYASSAEKPPSKQTVFISITANF